MFRTEILVKENIHLLQDLYLDAFNQKRSINEIENKFDTERLGYGYVSFLVFTIETNELAGFYGVFPNSFYYNGKKHLCAQIGDLMTHSNFRRKGVFEFVAKETHNYLKDIGFKFIFTFPANGASSYFGFVNKLNFKEKKINSYSIVINTLPLSRFFLKSKITEKIYYWYFDIISRFFFKNDFDTYSIVENRNSIIHNDFLIDYKSKLSPINYFIKDTLGKGFVKVDRDGGLSIGFLDVKNNSEFKLLMNKLKKMCGILGIRYIHFEISENNFLDVFLSEISIKNQLYRVCYKELDDIIDVSNIEFDFIDIDSY